MEGICTICGKPIAVTKQRRNAQVCSLPCHKKREKARYSKTGNVAHVARPQNVNCRTCGQEIGYMRQWRGAVYCSNECRKKYLHDEYIKLNPSARLDVSSGSVGAASELIVCADLLFRGFCVFRAVSPACPFDLLICTKDIAQVLRVEVTTGAYLASGKLMYPNKDFSTFDILAVVIKSTRAITYLPKEPAI